MMKVTPSNFSGGNINFLTIFGNSRASEYSNKGFLFIYRIEMSSHPHYLRENALE